LEAKDSDLESALEDANTQNEADLSAANSDSEQNVADIDSKIEDGTASDTDLVVVTEDQANE
jgi:hypothetical protein